MTDREEIIVIGPPKPVAEMSEAEYDAWVDALADAAVTRLHGPDFTPDPPDVRPGGDT